MDYHTNELQKVCRVCAKRLKKAKGKDRSFPVSEHSKELYKVFRIDTSADAEDTRPLFFCLSCKVFMSSWHSRGGSAPAVGRVFAWAKHSEVECMVSRSPYLVYHALRRTLF